MTSVRITVCFLHIAAVIATRIKAHGQVPGIGGEYPHAMRDGSFAALIQITDQANLATIR